MQFSKTLGGVSKGTSRVVPVEAPTAILGGTQGTTPLRTTRKKPLLKEYPES